MSVEESETESELEENGGINRLYKSLRSRRLGATSWMLGRPKRLMEICVRRLLDRAMLRWRRKIMQ
jgi:hypothetical protein